jgi:hypothetical protein
MRLRSELKDQQEENDHPDGTERFIRSTLNAIATISPQVYTWMTTIV